MAEIGTYGEMKKGWVYAGGQKLAEFSPNTYMTWRHVNPVTGSWLTSAGGGYTLRNELDPLGADVGTSDPYVSYSYTYADTMGLVSLFEERGNPLDPGGGCGTLDGLPISCSELSMRIHGGSVEASYPGLRERDPNQSWRDPGPPRYVTPTRSIKDYGVGLYGLWMPSLFQNERSGPGVVFFTVPQKTDCSQFVDRLVGHARLNQKSGKVQVGRGFLSMIPRDQTAREQLYPNLSVSGFEDRLIKNQGGWAYAHITGIAGGTLIGRSPILLRGQTGDQLVQQQIGVDRGELNDALEVGKRSSTYDYYGTLRPVGEVIEERRSELADDEAGQAVGQILGSAIDRKFSFEDARNRIFNFLCDH